VGGVLVRKGGKTKTERQRQTNKGESIMKGKVKNIVSRKGHKGRKNCEWIRKRGRRKEEYRSN
jgi:hypothetical protein